MAYYLVKAKPRGNLMGELHEKLARGVFRSLDPYGKELTRSLLAARVDPETGDILWEEEDYCSPPLAQERSAVLDQYFEDIEVKRVKQGKGWSMISDLPHLWDKGEESAEKG
ncbi:MAG: hypothetical protein R3211_10375 [Balneolaceae bacterium]|nr:hypothetical protein [Balneolaceae bacterium]